MRKIPILIILLILVTSCNSKQPSSELNELKEKLNEKENKILDLQKQIKNSGNNKKITGSSQDYYLFTPNSEPEINVVEKLRQGEKKLIDKKDFNDTLDISDNFFVYRHTSKVFQTSDSEFESILRDFHQTKSEYADDFYVKVMTFYNGQSLPLETENSKTDIHILVQPTELGYKNKSFVISDFYNVELKELKKINNTIELNFEHGKFPRKNEIIIIRPELVRFKSYIPENVDSEFNIFLKHFSIDSIFQISRIDFPLKVTEPDWDNNFELIEKTIELHNYQLMNFNYKDIYGTRPVDAYEQNIELNGNNAKILIRGVDNGISTDYFFERTNRIWKLKTWIDYSN